MGSVNGALREAFSRIDKIHTTVDLSFAIVVGDLFASNDNEALTALLNHSLTVPITTYFTVGDHPLPQRVIRKLESYDEVCPNLFFLGRKGLLKTSEGVRIVTLGGRLIDEATTVGRYEASYTQDDARELRGNHAADILITNQWPLGIQNGSKNGLAGELPVGTQCISDLCSVLKPRYHFSSSPSAFFEREPFIQAAREDSPDVQLLTRFYSLASFNNPAKQKSVYAFNLDLSRPPALADNVIPSPFAAPAQKRRTLPEQRESYSRFENAEAEYRRPPKRRRNNPANDPSDPRNCFFCVGNENCAAHLICSVGVNSYLSVPKGPIPLHSTFPTLGLPAHIQIIPLAHAPTNALIDAIKDGYTPEETFAEMRQYHQSLCKFLHIRAVGSLGAVIWEVSRSNIRHFFHQFLPIPVQMVRDGLVEAAFKLVAEKDHQQQFERCDPDHMFTAADGDYFRIWIWTPPAINTSDPVAAADALNSGETNDGSDMSLVVRLGNNERFNINFGRKVVTGLLKLEQRYSWQNSVQTEEEESKEKDTFDKAFKPFDFTRVDL